MTEPRPTADTASLADAFEAQRPRLQRLAYAATGSVAEAEDCVQEAWLRLTRVPDPGSIADLPAWLTTTVSRLALDALGSARARRERSAGPWLPEPLVADLRTPDPADQVSLDELVSMALLVVLERLSPAERTAFVLHDVFDVDFEEIAEVVGRTPGAVRQLASRARKHVRAGQPRFPPTRAEQAEIVTAFAAACANGDIDQLTRLLDPGVTWRADGGGKVTAAPVLAHGARDVARLLLGFAGRGPAHVRMVLVNGAPGLVVRDAGQVLSVIALTVDGGRITAIDIIRDPDKLSSASGLT